jgi:tRNA1Val (adenine37-N6)-methyltransferase
MPNPVFHFKQFTIHQERCAMKVGTDSVLLGSWVQTPKEGRMLDVGTGTGIIALMLAQRYNGEVLGIDVDAQAVEQARENFANSPWGLRLKAVQRSFQEQLLQNDAGWDLIVSNPPYFNQSFKAPEESRNLARHTIMLDLETLVLGAASLLSSGGSFAIILPSQEGPKATELAKKHGLFLSRCTEVITRPGKPPKRWLLQWTTKPVVCQNNQLVIEAEGRHRYSEAYQELTRDFYLNG